MHVKDFNFNNLMTTKAPNYHSDVTYDNKQINFLKQILYQEYIKRNNYGYRKYNSLQLECNVYDTCLSNNDKDNINRIIDADKRLRRTVHEFVNLPVIKDWGSNFGKDGHFVGIITDYEHTFLQSHSLYLYHPHVHMYLWMSDVYNNAKVTNLYHNPSLSTLCKDWLKCIRDNYIVTDTAQASTNHNLKLDICNPVPHYQKTFDLFYCIPGYIKTKDNNDCLDAVSLNQYHRHQQILTMSKNGIPIYLRHNYKRRILLPTDDNELVKWQAYYQAREFSKYFKSEKQYYDDMERGIRDKNMTTPEYNQYHQLYRLPIDKGYYAHYQAKKIDKLPRWEYLGMAYHLKQEVIQANLQPDYSILPMSNQYSDSF